MSGNVSFCWGQFCRCVINRLGHAFPWTQNVFTNGALIPKIYSACSFADAMFSWGSFRETFSLHCVFRASTEHFQEQICIFLYFAPAQRVQKMALVSSGTKASVTLWENRKGHVCLLLFHEWHNSELLRGYPYLLNTLLILMIFWNKYGRVVMVGMYVLCGCTSKNIIWWFFKKS